jgi:hypothetical protein
MLTVLSCLFSVSSRSVLAKATGRFFLLALSDLFGIMAGMNQILLNLSSSWKNKHVSIPAFLFILCEVGAIWLPQFANQFTLTGKILMGYTVLAAANSGPSTETQPATLAAVLKSPPEGIPAPNLPPVGGLTGTLDSGKVVPTVKP